MNKSEKMKYMISYICVAILMLFFLSIAVRVFTRQAIVKCLGINNAFTSLVFFDSKNMEEKPSIDEDFGESTQGTEYQRVDIDWKALYPFGGTASAETDFAAMSTNSVFEPYTSKIEHLEEKIQAYTGDLLAGQGLITQMYYEYNKLINWKWGASGADDDSTIIYMNNGYLTYQQPKIDSEDIDEIADSLQDFSNYLETNNIPFLYVNAGSKVNPVDKQLRPLDASLEFTNENGDALQNALDIRDVPYIDMREEMLNANLDWYDSYYKTDHHWKAETGLWAAGVIAGKLNEIADMNFDSSYFAESSYHLTRHENIMFGGQGNVVTHANADPEDFTEIIPKFPTSFHVTIPSKSFDVQGDYETALYDFNSLETVIQTENGGNAYSCVRWTNDDLGMIQNNMAENNSDKKLLILSDSFGYFLNTYLACDIGETHIIHPMAFDGSIRTYIEQMKPDAVMVLYCERNIQPIDWNTHLSQFDFR